MPGAMRRTARRTSRRTSRRVNRRQDAMNSPSEPQYYDEPAPAPAAAPAPPPVEEADPYKQLTEAKKLLDAGILTEEEFAAEKKKILG